jgi:hypothetical protein
MPPRMRTAWVTRKRTKMGARTETDSFTPRRFMTTRAPMASASSGTFQAARPGGRKEKTASPPEATDTEMVRT